ncbi:MAG: RAMP superfamily CRISPR-associated protein [Thiotrichales bacterium]|nr:RAMP superfamily CRISPR-associated protein [Thiotrichales bacterium]
MLDIDMNGKIAAESDISVSPPDHEERDGPARVMTLPVKSVWRDGRLETSIYLPGSSIRGALRNGASRAVAAARKARGAAMTPEHFLLVAKGGIKDRKSAGTDERLVDYLENEKLRREEPLVSLFGAMERKIAGRWQIGDAVPIEPVTPNRKGRGVRSHPFQREPDLARFMDEAAYGAFLERDAKRIEANVAEGQAEDLQRKIAAKKRRPEPDVAQIGQWEAEEKRLRATASTLSEEAGGMVNIQQVLGGWQAIPEGTTMRHRMRLRDVTDRELTVAFFALRRLAREGRLGAHETRAEGYFRAAWDLRLSEDGGDFEPAGKLCIEDLGVRIESDHPVLATAFQRSATILDEKPDDTA